MRTLLTSYIIFLGSIRPVARQVHRGMLRWVSMTARAIVLAACCLGSMPATAETVIIQGSTTFNSRLLEPYKAAIESMAGLSLQVIPNKSLNGLIALLDGRAHLAMVSAPLEKELVPLRASYNASALGRLQGHQIANSRIAFALHPSNPVRKASLDTIRRILAGNIVNWHEIGGPDLPIRVVFVAKAGGVTQTVQSRLLDDGPIAAAHPIPLASPEQVIKVVEQESGALGLAQIRLVAARSLPELATDETIEQHLVLVTLGEPSTAAQAVIEAARKIAQQRLALSQN